MSTAADRALKENPLRPADRPAILAWPAVALFTALSQIALFRELAPGEFGTVNTVLGLVAVLAAPLLALSLIFQSQVLPDEDLTGHQASRASVMELCLLIWSGVSIVLLLVLLPLLSLPRLSVDILAVLVAGATYLAILGNSLSAFAHRARLWLGLVVTAAVLRFLASVAFPHFAPFAQSGLAAVVLAGFITALPVMRERTLDPNSAATWALVRGRRFLLPYLATASVMMAVAIFTNADRVVAQMNFGTPTGVNVSYVDFRAFDDYQAAGMIARALLWGTLPLLRVMYLKRSALPQTSKASLHFFWIYLFALFAADFVMGIFAPYLSSIFTGDAIAAARFIPGFAGAVPMLGLLQGVGIFVLASRRYPECFTFAGCSVAYGTFLTFCGREPQLMTSCMFGGAMMSLMVVLLVGIIRYARSHP